MIIRSPFKNQLDYFKMLEGNILSNKGGFW